MEQAGPIRRGRLQLAQKNDDDISVQAFFSGPARSAAAILALPNLYGFLILNTRS